MRFDVLVGADGVWSRVRKAVQELDTTFRVTHRLSPKAFKTFAIEPKMLPWSALRKVNEAFDEHKRD